MGSQFQKVHLFATSGQDTYEFEDLGPVTSSAISRVDVHPNIECIDIGVSRNFEYQLNPKAFSIERMIGDKEDTMFSRGWKLDCTIQEITIEELQDSITYCLKGKQMKEKKPFKIPREKKVKSSTSIIDLDEAILKYAIGGTCTEYSTKIRFVDPKVLEKEVQKALKSDTRGMEKYAKYFPFKYKEFEIPIDQCWLAPDHYNSHQVEPNRVDACMLFFGASANRP